MRIKAVTLAFVVAIIALPVPASQLLNGTFSASARPSAAAPEDSSLGLLLQDPFLVDRMSYIPAAGPSVADPNRGSAL